MRNPKQAALEAIQQLPDDCSVEDVLYQIYLLTQVMQGLQQAQVGEKVSREQLLAHLEEGPRN